MEKLVYLLSGGFARGYRTTILSALGVVTALGFWAVGDQSGADTVQAIWQALASLSVGTLGAKVDRNRTLLAELEPVAGVTLKPLANLSEADVVTIAGEVWDYARSFNNTASRDLPQLTGNELVRLVRHAIAATENDEAGAS